MKHDRIIQIKSKTPTTEPITMPAIAPPVRPVLVPLPLSANTVTVAVGASCRWTNWGGLTVAVARDLTSCLPALVPGEDCRGAMAAVSVLISRVLGSHVGLLVI